MNYSNLLFIRYQKLLEDVCFWLDEDDGLDGFRFRFLHYCVTCDNLLDNEVKPKISEVGLKINDLDVKINDLQLKMNKVEFKLFIIPYDPIVYLGDFCLSPKALQFFIDSCLFIIDVKTLHHFLFSLGCVTIPEGRCRKIELAESHLKVASFDFRRRRKYFKVPLQAVATNRSKFYAGIDTFLKYSDFRTYFLKLLEWDDFFSIEK